jgi:hypothetical protein
MREAVSDNAEERSTEAKTATHTSFTALGAAIMPHPLRAVCS